MRKIIALASPLAALTLLGCATIDHGISDRFSSYLTGGLMAPGARGDPNASGLGLLWIGEVPGPTCYNVSVRRAEGLTQGHLHRSAIYARWPADGPIVATLKSFKKGKSIGCFKNLNGAGRQLSQEIKANPSAFYFDVHSSEFPGGALRGKLEPASPDVDDQSE